MLHWWKLGLADRTCRNAGAPEVMLETCSCSNSLVQLQPGLEADSSLLGCRTILAAPLELDVEPGEDIATFSRRLGIPEAAVIEANGGGPAKGCCSDILC